MLVRGHFKVTGVRELHLCLPGPAFTEGDTRDQVQTGQIDSRFKYLFDLFGPGRDCHPEWRPDLEDINEALGHM
ncbi:hypothetical protein Trydic_g10474 [Trypoxylus dichotomus]